MNFLSHIYLSGDNELLSIGNFIGDFVKGKQQLEFLHTDIKRGVLLHRKIDEYFDQHEIVKHQVQRLRPLFGRYSGVILDLIYDHILAKKFSQYHIEPLREFTNRFYELTQMNKSLLPNTAVFVSERMKEQDWLFHYSSIEGIQLVANKMERRIGGKLHFNRLNEYLIEDIIYLESRFELVFNDMIKKTSSQKV